MKREDIKSYKDACKCISRKPRKYKDDHMNTYEQLTTIIAALNFIANGNKPWQHELYKSIKYWYIWCCSSSMGLPFLNYSHCVGYFSMYNGIQLRLKEQNDAEYLKTNFADLLLNWFGK